MATVSIVIPNFNGSAWLPGCLDALAAQTYGDFEIILVDNGSTDDSRRLVAERYPQVRVLGFATNAGFVGACNTGIRAAQGRLIALLNTDTLARPGWLAALVHALDAAPSTVGGVTSKMLRMDDPTQIDDAGDTLSWHGFAHKRGHGQPAAQFTQAEAIFAPCAGAALYRRSFVDAVDGLDGCFFAYLEDIDLALRGHLLGYTFLFVPDAEVLHKGHGSAMPQAAYVRAITRNRLLLFLKNIPFHLLVRRVGHLLYGQIYFAIAYRRPLTVLAAYGDVLRLLPHVLKCHRWMRSHILISVAELDTLLTRQTGEPPLRALLWKRLGRS